MLGLTWGSFAQQGLQRWPNTEVGYAATSRKCPRFYSNYTRLPATCLNYATWHVCRSDHPVAMQRREKRGLHYSWIIRSLLAEAEDTILQPPNAPTEAQAQGATGAGPPRAASGGEYDDYTPPAPARANTHNGRKALTKLSAASGALASEPSRTQDMATLAIKTQAFTETGMPQADLTRP